MKPDATVLEASRYRELTQRIAESRHFNKSPRQSGLLLHLCNHVFEHPGQELREQEIGIEVFRREAGYDTNLDNVVRVNASELRKRLALYFENEGVDEPVILEIPKGGYIPRFTPRPLPEALPSPAKPWALYLVCGLCAVLTVSTAWLAMENQALRHPALFQSPALRLLWSRILPDGGAADVVVADSSLSLLQDMLQQPVTLKDYLSHDYVARMMDLARPRNRGTEADWLTSRRYTSLADVNLVAALLTASRGSGFTVQFARDYPADRIRSANAVLIGSRRSNPWVEIFEEKMNFRMDIDAVSSEPFVENRKPVAGEQATYRVTGLGSHASEGFAVVAFLPNQTGTGQVLIIAGSGMQGTRAAGDLVTSEREFGRFLDRLGKPWPGKLPHFEVLLKTRIMGGTVRGFDVVAHRTYE